MHRRTKIVCTLGPSVDSKEQIAALIDAGMNVARLNCSHGDWETRRKWIGWLRELSPDAAPVGILADLQGPKFRIGPIAGGSVDLSPGQALTVGPDPVCTITIDQPEILAELDKGDRLLLGDGNVELRIKKATGKKFEAEAVTGGLVRSRQGLTLVGKVFQTPAITDKDREDAHEACEADVDFLALSYVHAAADLEELRELVKGKGRRIRLCAKIETRAALKNLDEILGASDFAMVARGDLGLQMDLEDVPMAQKKIIRKSNEIGKPVITATQMLESMVQAPRPTRAEVADVANAILDGTDAIMLSGETANGMYPIECVKAMARIATKAESIVDHDALLEGFHRTHRSNTAPTHAVAYAVAQLASITRPDAILTTTTSGQTARLVSKFRPATPILCATWDNKTHTQMSVVWGVESIHIGLPSTTDEIVQIAMEGFKKHKRLKVGDKVIVTAGVPAGQPGHTNLILSVSVE